MPKFRLRRRDPDAPEWLELDRVYLGEFDREPGSDRAWLHHPDGPQAGKYVALFEDVELVE